jgi:ribosomal protein S18 acetylase RimI-like enzyme
VEFSVRPASSSDADAIAAVHVAGWRWGYRDLLPPELLDGLDADERAERLRAVMNEEEPTVAVHLADAGGRVIGFVSSGPSRDSDGVQLGEIYALYVEEHVAGMGVGVELLRTAVESLRQRGFDRATLWVLDTNARARRFYEREAWTPDGGINSEEFRGVTLHEVRYARQLAAGL